MRRVIKFFIGFVIGVGIGAVVGSLGLGIGIGIAFGAVFTKLIKADEEKICIYNFDLIAKIPKELKGKSKGVRAEDWFVEANDGYNILNQINIDFDYCEENDLKYNDDEFIVEVRIEDGDAFHKEYLHEHIKKVLRNFENDFNTKWKGEFYIDDGKKDYICYAPNFELEIND
tara:strand:+ start:7770 stop:8285 length:516 start_codon:yes stop_codon:yes gene_type:complete